MLPDLTSLAVESLTPLQYLGIPVALLGAVFLAVGAQLQHRGVAQVEARAQAEEQSAGVEALQPGAKTAGLSLRQLAHLAARPSWLIGTAMLGLAVVLQLTSLYLAPITLVQPLGAVALVITAVLNARVSRVKLDGVSIRAIAFCVVGVALFVGVAAFTTRSHPVSNTQVLVILGILAVVAIAFAVLFVVYRSRLKALMYILGAGILYGFVATLAKVVIDRMKTGDFEWLTFAALIALLIGTVLGGYFVQNAYASGPPDLVIAGLTVVDPIIAVTIGITVLGEASDAHWSVLLVFLVAGALAVRGVFMLAQHHPQSRA
ncbi:multidrug DMT transporter permease [Salinibacterium sp. dk2585]|uniref:multidrug DMT transporter permease n=1 Tax=unclassified Salinibacterium TaxID=2632331 RepID=UPI0011C24273|nr:MULTISPECIES: multidrug DMT transporter permease [unclassified Salinibacterium]QEE61373.1 multidrug DMT transporter permease [Salinibacterium sp. dk2585]TXK54050.1 multidrug DMT transporter permease [Salinibacterium sp. dk5596]